MHDYYTCLNTPSHLPSSKPSTADTRKDGAAPLPNALDATSQDPQVINGPHGPSLERHLLYATKNSNQCHHSHADDYTADAPQEPHNARTHIIFMPHMPSMAPHPAIKRVGSPSPPIEAARMWLYSMSSMPTTFARYPSRNGQQKNSCVPTVRHVMRTRTHMSHSQ